MVDININATIHLHVDDPKALEAVQARLGLVLEASNRVLDQGVSLMGAADDMKASIAKLDATDQNLAADIQRLKDKIKSAMSPAEVAEVQSALDAVVAKFQGLANDPDNPDPAPVPVPVPEPQPEPEPPAQA